MSALWFFSGVLATLILLVTLATISNEYDKQTAFHKNVADEFVTLEKRVCDLECKIVKIPKGGKK
jgi:hypothetical protein